jgi:hypothetical protein
LIVVINLNPALTTRLLMAGEVRPYELNSGSATYHKSPLLREGREKIENFVSKLSCELFDGMVFVR